MPTSSLPSPSCAATPDGAPGTAVGGAEDYLQALFPPDTRVLELPNLRSSTLYIPAEGGVAQRWRATAMYPGNRPVARLLRVLARGAGAAGVGRSRIVGPGSDGWALGAFLRGALPAAAGVSVLLRLADTSPRATIQIRDPAGRVLGYAKYAVHRHGIARLERECEVLSSGLPHGAPHVLKFGPLGGGKALLLSQIEGRRFWAVLPPPPGLIEFLGRQPASAPVPLSQHPWVDFMRRATAGETDAVFAEIDGTPWPVVVHHGDLIASNLCIGADGSFAAVDWEYGTCAGFPHLDLLQYILLVLMVLRRRPAPAAARQAAAWLASQSRFAVSASVARALTRLAGFDLWVNGRGDGEQDEAPQQLLWRAIAVGRW